jgi:glycosyltransferase involved in cell wall biosynthesis
MSEVETITDAAEAERRAPCVLQVLPALVTGGVERGTVDLAQALASRGWISLVASAGGPMVREVERAGARHIALPLDSKNPFVMRANVARLAKAIVAHRVDIVHARSRAPAWSARAAARRTGARFVTTFHNAYGATTALKRRYNAVMGMGERVIAISGFVARHAIETYGIPEERVRVVPRGIDMARFDPDRIAPDRLVALARQWGLPDSDPVVMLPGRLARWKGHGVLIAALRRLGRPALTCLFVGSGSERYRRALEAEMTRNPPPCAVRFVDECRDMPAAYKLAGVVVSASTDPEGFGRVAVEAQAMGRPVIATAHGGALETVLPGETGWLVPPGDADALAAALADALDLAPEDRVALADRAMAHVRAHFTVERMTDHTIAIYEELLGIGAHAHGPVAA